MRAVEQPDLWLTWNFGQEGKTGNPVRDTHVAPPIPQEGSPGVVDTHGCVSRCTRARQ